MEKSHAILFDKKVDGVYLKTNEKDFVHNPKTELLPLY